ncbi:hypothetical protein AF332_16965 [Sporosarcina globispora]|uniref:Uncharacterized protein n=1 Tax=Sporosarcina globispora TaxID=1459 RepID=A0A0M0GEH9_SPOGL|nr:hypothetical protein AF332_16965 [Sporosarcina globispora]
MIAKGVVKMALFLLEEIKLIPFRSSLSAALVYTFLFGMHIMLKGIDFTNITDCTRRNVLIMRLEGDLDESYFNNPC